ncbi:hypothetical protein AMTRI_Chr09g32220 [Amborella trichopoda]|uniref:plastid division protein CDP1, chloroplastic n=1 Tax=Amborella trichopoda TaxID=13333 RepID=UPI0009C0A832|nr:plastid division protein CDP1, chloroplastic [Amborella trichopoda]|eukprot:XP_011624786.2 plastid division protein CDP1, chloroplastic [Amborella trichopoda]
MLNSEVVRSSCMASAHSMLSISTSCPFNGAFEETRRASTVYSLSGKTSFHIGRFLSGPSLDLDKRHLRGSKVNGTGRLKVTEAQTVENGEIRKTVEIPVSCYQIVGVPGQAEKDEIVKSVLELKSAEVEEGYTMDAVVSRQDLLMDVRDKLLFEPEYAGNIKENVPPKSSLCIPWAWLPGALCLLQEVGEEKMVLEIGRSALQHQDDKPYVHDVLLSMALAECSIAKSGFEKGKVAQGFEALARGQYLLRSKISLGKIPLLAQIEESLEELAPACTLEFLSMPHTPENAERRRGAIAALRELLRQGLEVETSCRVRDWPCFLGQATSKLMATEIVDLLSWDTLSLTRKNKKSLESQNQRVVIDFNCFYIAMLAHVALGFLSRQTDLIQKAKTICECLEASEGINLKFEEALCSFLLGQGGELVAAEWLAKLETNVNPTFQNVRLAKSGKEDKSNTSAYHSLEKWLKDSVLGVFADTHDCSPSLVNFFRAEKRSPLDSKQKKKADQSTTGSLRSSSLGGPFPTDHKLGVSDDTLRPLSSVLHVGAAVKRLTPANMQSQISLGKANSNHNSQSVQMKRNFGNYRRKLWESWWASEGVAGRLCFSTFLGCCMFGTFKLLSLQVGRNRIPNWYSNQSTICTSAFACTRDQSLDPKIAPISVSKGGIGTRINGLILFFKKQLKHPLNAGPSQNLWPVDDLSALNKAPTGGSVLLKREMPFEEAEALVKQWQNIKSEALGPNHHIHCLPEILAESMLSQWQALAESARLRSCFWRFLLLQVSILRAEIVSDGIGWEMAEIEAVLEEAAELIDESQPKNPNYYSTYQIRYVLKRQYDGTWKFCGGGIQTPA